MFRARYIKLHSLLLILVLLASCGGSDSPEKSSSESFPLSISYKNLAGQIKGDVLGLAIAQTFAANCQAGQPCLSSFQTLMTKQEFQNYVAQTPGGESNKPRVLAAGNAVDFSLEQIWAFKYGTTLAGLAVRLDIEETASQIEVRAVVCNSINADAPFPLYDVFAILQKNVAAKPVVILGTLPCGS